MPTAPTADEIRAGKAHYDAEVDELIARAREELATGSEPAAVFGLLVLATLDNLPEEMWGALAGLVAAFAVRAAQQEPAR